MTPGTATPVYGAPLVASTLSSLLLVTCAVAFWAAGEGVFAGSRDPSLRMSEAAAQAMAVRRAEHEAFTAVYGSISENNVTISGGETLVSAMRRAGATQDETNRAVRAISTVYDPRGVRPGQVLTLAFDRSAAPSRLLGLSFRSEPGSGVTVSRSIEGAFTAREVHMPLTYEIARIAANVETSIYEAAISRGATEQEIASLADAFGYDTDFQRDVRPGDHFELVFERFFDDQGRTVRTGDLMFVSLATRRGERAFYRFRAPGDDQAEWYDVEGKSARKFLMKTPINGARLSSGFGVRRHPILGFSRMHQGTDFAAPIGTPIMAAGDGVVVEAGVKGGYGNYIRIRHDQEYQTAYAHLSRWASGMRPGTRVQQGQIIGYVGSTGRSTGPHLHYEVHFQGRQINPMGLAVPTGRNLQDEALTAFFVERDRIDRMRQARNDEQAGLQSVSQTVAMQDEGTLRARR
ncbi:MAG: peptidoglycan DD-metalloendopeptidase family protein [Caulobacterales bacterium]|jgi:murein DD-endopeptidase MepM/ murein hydrolase activator NlpD